MALNFSHQPVFASHLGDEHLISSMRISDGYYVDDVQENNGDGFCKSWRSNHNKQHDCFDYGSDRGYISSSQEAVSSDILDLLPSDPFGMDISTTFTAITGWLEDLEVDYGGYGKEEVGTSHGHYQLFAGLNFLWNNAIQFQSFPGNMEFGQRASTNGGSGEWSMDDIEDASCDSTVGQAAYVENNSLSLDGEKMNIFGFEGDFMDGIEDGSNGVKQAPHPALAFALGYLGVRDLLAVENVCRSLRCTVRSDPLLWRNIHVDQLLNEKIIDDFLLQLTERAQGNLQSLSLIDCPRITDEGLKGVFERNPRLTKLSVPGCTRLSIEGVVNCLRAHKIMGAPGVKHLRIGGLYGVTQEHFAELKLLLGVDTHRERNVHNLHFYHRGSFYLSGDDNRDIDIEMCPRCLNLRLVYDCPAEACQGKNNGSDCRACTLCISRCAECGRCINDSEYVETFCLELLCSDCWKQLSKSQESQRGVGSSKYNIFGEARSICIDG